MLMLIDDIEKFVLLNNEHLVISLILAKIVGAVLFIPGIPLTLLAGSLLGKFEGTIVSIIGNVLGANAAFLLSRYLFRDMVEKKLLPKYPKIKEYDELFFKNGLKTVLFLRLVPLFPFNALNYVLGITRVSFKDYFIGTLFGIIPGTIAFVYLGESLKMLSIYNILFAVVAIIALGYIGKFWKLK